MVDNSNNIIITDTRAVFGVDESEFARDFKIVAICGVPNKNFNGYYLCPISKKINNELVLVRVCLEVPSIPPLINKNGDQIEYEDENLTKYSACIIIYNGLYQGKYEVAFFNRVEMKVGKKII